VYHIARCLDEEIVPEVIQRIALALVSIIGISSSGRELINARPKFSRLALPHR
jgi:hypothetical protein